MEAQGRWYPALVEALDRVKQQGSSIKGVFQLATYDHPSSTPRVRSHILRSFVTPYSHPSLPLLISTTDIRTPKVTQVSPNANGVEVVFWTEPTLEQFRISGRVYFVPSPSYAGTYPHIPSPGYSILFDALRQQNFDWEQTRLSTFNHLNGHMRASWCRPVPGTPMKGGYDDALEWPESLPALGEAKDEEEEKNVEEALKNFALVVIEPFEVDFVELGTKPEKRTVYRREPQETEFTETIVVP
ncbi:pyridoxamine 5'-phosphate oxidase-domain-containing protein [Pisolithus marmoratus]|nr:pyridoxamine 5'-phosphate oxidase-domain-containing protein [Pisolithus marmoratus]